MYNVKKDMKRGKMEIIVATKNKGKIEELQEMFKDLDFVKISSIDYNEIEEYGKTFKVNSLIKAEEVKKYTDKIVLSDDSGLIIKEYGTWPGVNTARIYEELDSYDLKCKKILKKMEGVQNREAEFVCVITLIMENGDTHQFVGKSEGKIHDKLEGKNGHGYDPIFYSNDLQKTFASATIKEKASVSHRGRAFEKVKAFLNSIK